MKFTFAPEARPLSGYTIKRAIDRGGFGEVYYGISDSGKEVALKLLQQHQEVELRGTSQCLNLKHPNLVTLFDIRTDADGDRWVIMEYVSGPSLEQVLLQHPRGLPTDEVEQWLAGLAAGVGFLHERGIVHRDLKPANIFRENGVVKVGDVGLSKFITPSRRSAQTESVGTVYYMAPEVARGKYGSELDVYSTGVILFEMLTGQLPFDGESTGEILMKHLTAAPDVSRLPVQFQGVVSRALAKDPQQRTASLGQLLNEFRQARGDSDAAGSTAAAAAPVFAPAPPVKIYEVRATKRRAAASGNFFRRNRWEIIVLGFLALLVLQPIPRPGAFHLAVGIASLPFLAFVGGAAYATYRVVSWLAWSSGIFARPALAPASQQQAAGRPHFATSPTAARYAASPAAPHRAPRARNDVLPMLPARLRWAEVSGGMARATVWGLLATAGISATTSLFGNSAEQGLDAGRCGLFALVTVLAAWLIIGVSKFWEGRSGDPLGRRLVLAGLGSGLGVAAYWLDGILMAGVSFDNRTRSLFASVGHQRLVSDAVQPTLVGYMLFFAMLFGLRCWWRQSDAFRNTRFRISSLLLTTFVGFAVPMIFVFPQHWGAGWAAAISAVVQLASAWAPPDVRRRREACRHVT